MSNPSSSWATRLIRRQSNTWSTVAMRLTMAGLCLVVMAQASLAQQIKKSPVEDRVLKTDDGFDLKISYYKSISGKEAPVVVLLHGQRGQRLQWKGFATDLQTKGDFAVVTVDLRGHGESPKKDKLKKGDYQAMAAFDMAAVREFIYDEHQKGALNMNKLGIVACDFAASIALVYTDIDWKKTPFDDSTTPEQRTPRGQDVKALALISPDTSVLPTNPAVNFVREIRLPVMVAAAEKNSHDLATSRKLFEQLAVKRETDEKLYFAKYPAEVKGMDLVLQDADLRSHLFAFLDKYVKQVPSVWRDRRSRAERD